MDSTESRWSLVHFTSLTQAERDELRDLINRANRVRPRIFPGDRIIPVTLEKNYGDCEVIRLSDEGICSGCLFLRVEGLTLWLLLLAVAPERQGQGLGASLIHQADRFARNRKMAELKLQAVGERLANYYLRHGFQVEVQETMPIGKWGSPEPFELWTLMREV